MEYIVLLLWLAMKTRNEDYAIIADELTQMKEARSGRPEEV